MAYQNPVVGGKTGSRNFTDERYQDGKSVMSIQVWPDDTRIRGIDVWFTGQTKELGEKVSHGKYAGKCSRFELQPGELITSMELWPSKNGDRLGWMQILTNKNREFYYGATKGSPSRFMDVKSGIWVGVYGYAGDDIDNMGASFLYPIKIQKMVSVKYRELNFHSGSINMAAVRAFSLGNNMDDKTLTLHVNDAAIFTNTSKWEITSSYGLVSFQQILPKPPSILQGEVIIPVLNFSVVDMVGWNNSSLPIVFNNINSSNSTNLSINFTQQRDVIHGESTKLDGNVYKGTITIPFDGYLEITPDVNISKYSIPISGSYSGVVYGSNPSPN